jgi:hypothetical protein
VAATDNKISRERTNIIADIFKRPYSLINHAGKTAKKENLSHHEKAYNSLGFPYSV